MFERGKIILVPFPFTDLSSQKVRPAVILSANVPHAKDVIVAFVSSVVDTQLRSHILVSETVSKFEMTGLKKSSVIRCDKIATLDRRIVLGELGTLPPTLMKQVNVGLRRVLGL